MTIEPRSQDALMRLGFVLVAGRYFVMIACIFYLCLWLVSCLWLLAELYPYHPVKPFSFLVVSESWDCPSPLGARRLKTSLGALRKRPANVLALPADRRERKGRDRLCVALPLSRVF
jgi:hypothetical protein